MKLKIIYEDEFLLAVDKPAGLVTTPSETQGEITLSEILQTDYHINVDRGGVAHRLDKDTSGIVLVAKTPEILLKLQEQFKSREIKKEYICLVHGILDKAGKVEGSIGRNPGNREKFIVLPSGKEAVTEYAPIKSLQLVDDKLQSIFSDYNKIQMKKLQNNGYGKFTLVKCYPKTGRTHQIRVHLKYIGFPIVGDEKYVGRKMFRLDHRWCSRQFLHAGKIGFSHPVKDEWMDLESKLPEDLTDVLALLEG